MHLSRPSAIRGVVSVKMESEEARQKRRTNDLVNVVKTRIRARSGILSEIISSQVMDSALLLTIRRLINEQALDSSSSQLLEEITRRPIALSDVCLEEVERRTVIYGVLQELTCYVNSCAERIKKHEE